MNVEQPKMDKPTDKRLKIRRETDQETAASQDDPDETGNNLSVPSQSIVDELFKEFISKQKIQPVKQKNEASAKSSSIDEMSALLDREISLIGVGQSHSQELDIENGSSLPDTLTTDKLEEDETKTECNNTESSSPKQDKEADTHQLEENQNSHDDASDVDSKGDKHSSSRHKSKKRHKRDDLSKHRSSSKKKHKNKDVESHKRKSSKKKHKRSKSPDESRRKRCDNDVDDEKDDNLHENKLEQQTDSSSKFIRMKGSSDQDKTKENSLEKELLSDCSLPVESVDSKSLSVEQKVPIEDKSRLQQECKLTEDVASRKQTDDPPAHDLILKQETTDTVLVKQRLDKDGSNLPSSSIKTNDTPPLCMEVESSVKSDLNPKKEHSDHQERDLATKKLSDNLMIKTDTHSIRNVTSSQKIPNSPKEDSSYKKKHKRKKKRESSEERKLRKEEKRRKRERDFDHPTFEDIHSFQERLEETLDSETKVKHASDAHSRDKSTHYIDRQKDFDNMKAILDKIKQDKNKTKFSSDNRAKKVDTVKITSGELKVIVDKNKIENDRLKDKMKLSVSKLKSDMDDDDDVIIIEKSSNIVGEPLKPLNGSNNKHESEVIKIDINEIKPEPSVQQKHPIAPVLPSASVTNTFDLESIPLPQPGAKTKALGNIKLGLNLKITSDSAEFIASGEKVDKKGKRREEGEVSSESDDDGDSSSNDGDDDDEEEDDDSKISETGSLPDSDSKSKKKKNSHKHKKKKKHKTKDKESDKEKSKKRKGSKRRGSREQSRDRKKSKRDRDRSRSRSRSDSRGRKKIVLADRGWDAYLYAQDVTPGHKGDRHKQRYSRSRSKSRSRRQSRSRSRSRHRSRSRSRSRVSRKRRSRSRSVTRKKDKNEDLRLHIDKKKLRKIAIANALANLKNGNSADLACLKSGGKSVEELTDFCKGLAGKDRGQFSSSDSDSPGMSDDDQQPFINHPFIVRESAPIIMNIRNSKQLPILSLADKNVGVLRTQFPVSSGNQHRLKELEWVPVEKTTASATTTSTALAVTTIATTKAADIPTTTTPSVPTPVVASIVVDPVFPKPVTLPIDIGAIVSERLQAVRKLQENPYDIQALSRMHKSQAKASEWATSQFQPGTFTGSTGVQILSKAELEGGNKNNRAWLKKDQFRRAEPVKSGIGMFLLQKMGWRAGEGLGKNNEGSLEPLMLDLKVDRKGLQTQSEGRGNQKGGMNNRRAGGGGGGVVGPAVGMSRPKDLSGKHPVSALLELCNRRKFGSPYFELIHESGPDHKKNFLFKVVVNGVEYQPSIASNNKKTAKSQAAAVCLQELGMLPRQGPI